MQRPSFVLSILRGFTWLSLVGLFALLYWSNLTLEEKVQRLAEEMVQFKQTVAPTPSPPPSPIAVEESPAVKVSERPWIDGRYLNLLEEDPYFESTLPKLLLEDRAARGIRRSAIAMRPENLHPFQLLYPISGFVQDCTLSVASQHVGRYETFAPEAAIKVEERAEGEYWVHLRENMQWQPLHPRWFPRDFSLSSHFLKKHPVTADDFLLAYYAIMNPFVEETLAVVERAHYADIEEFRVIDPLTFVVRWKKQAIEGADRVKYNAKRLTMGLSPLPAFVYLYYADGSRIVDDQGAMEIYQRDSAWAQQFSRHWSKNVIVSCGPWVFDGMDDSRIRFVKNRDYHNPLAVLVAAHEISFKPSVDAVWLDFKSGAIDTYTLLPHQELELEEFLKSEEYAKQAALGGKIGRIDYLQRAYNYVGWNSATPFFSSSRVRRAMTLAIDVGRLIDSNMGGMAEPITGPFFVHSPSYDKNVASLPFDPEEARSLLEEEGWSDRLGQGLRSKMVQGKEMPFRFTLHYFVKNKIAKLNCEMIADNLRQIGVDCRLNGLDVADLTRLFEDKAFDAIYMAWMLSAPPEDPRQLWSSKGAAQKGSSNVVGFIHPLADRIIEDLQYTFGKPERNQLYHRLHALLYQEQPYTFLYSPKSALLYRGWVENLFVPVARPDLIPEADVADPQLQLIRLRSHT